MSRLIERNGATSEGWSVVFSRIAPIAHLVFEGSNINGDDDLFETDPLISCELYDLFSKGNLID